MVQSTSTNSTRYARRMSISNETNTATPSALPFRPSRDTLDHSLVSHDENGLNTAHSVRQPDKPTVSVSAPVVQPIVDVTAAKAASSSLLDHRPFGKANTHDDELSRLPTATVSSNATDDVKLTTSEFNRITDDVTRHGGDHGPPEEVDYSNVPGTEEYGEGRSNAPRGSAVTAASHGARGSYRRIGGERILVAGRRVASKL